MIFNTSKSIQKNIFDMNLSYNAIGLYCSIKYREEVIKGDILQCYFINNKNGKDKVRNAMNELIENGLLKKETLRNANGKFNGYKYTIK